MIANLKGHNTAVKCLSSIENEPQLIASGSTDTTIKIWDLRQKTSALTMKCHTSDVNSIEVAPDATIILSGGSDCSVKLWDIRRGGKVLAELDHHSAPVNHVCFNPKDLTFATGGNDRHIKYWSVDTYQLVGESKPETHGIDKLTFDQEGRFLFTTANESLRVYS